MSAPDRASWVAALRAVLAIVEEHPEIRLPDIDTIGSHRTVSWWLAGEGSAEHMAVLEEALPCELAGSFYAVSGSGSGDWYKLAGDLGGGFEVEVSARAELVAEVTVASEVVEKREWARRPVDPQAAEGEERP